MNGCPGYFEPLNSTEVLINTSQCYCSPNTFFNFQGASLETGGSINFQANISSEIISFWC